MGHVIVVYAFLDDEGTDQEFTTQDLDVAFRRARMTGLKVVARHYRLETARVLKNYTDGFDDALRVEEETD